MPSMTNPASTWTYVKAWERSARALGVGIEGPVRVVVSETVTLEAEMLVRGFGARRGTLVFERADTWRSQFEWLRTQGLTASSFGPYPEGVECTLTEMVDVLGDWGWCGEGPEPPWLITIDAERWSQPSDFYAAFLTTLKAPSWHGQNLDALWDSVAGG